MQGFGIRDRCLFIGLALFVPGPQAAPPAGQCGVVQLCGQGRRRTPGTWGFRVLEIIGAAGRAASPPTQKERKLLSGMWTGALCRDNKISWLQYPFGCKYLPAGEREPTSLASNVSLLFRHPSTQAATALTPQRHVCQQSYYLHFHQFPNKGPADWRKGNS